MDGSFSGFRAVAARERLGGGEGLRSGDAARFFAGLLLDRVAATFSRGVASALEAGLTEAARVERLGGIWGADLSYEDEDEEMGDKRRPSDADISLRR